MLVFASLVYDREAQVSSPTYDAVACLQDGSDFSLDTAAKRLAEWVPEAEITRDAYDISVNISGWEVHLRLMDEPFVAQESKDVAQHFASCPRAEEIAKCQRRVEVYSTDQDPDMKHFNDFVSVCQALEGFRGVILFDPLSGELI
jgi:hypothetical protein